MIVRWVGAAVLLAGAAAPLAAQAASASLDLSVARMRFADSIDATAVSISPVLRAATDRYVVDAAGSLSRLQGAWSNSGAIDAAIVLARAGRLTLDATGIAGGSVHSGGTRTGQFLGGARARAALPGGAAWVGAAAGLTWDAEWRTLRRIDLGAWRSLGSSAIAIHALPTIADDTVRFTDTFFSMSHAAAPWTIGASLGVRAGGQLPSLPANRNVWGHVAATLALTERMAMVASGGTYPVDFAQGYPGGQFLSLGVRIHGGSSAPVQAIASPTPELSDFSLRRTGGAVLFRVRAPRARLVELSGDFTQWSNVRLQPAGAGWWSVSIPVTAGTYELNVRVDGGRWMVPPGTIPRRDEFGTVTGVVHVP